jgi:hypothetical protein
MKKGNIMKKLGILALVAFALIATGCAHSLVFNAGQVSAGYYTKAHEWKTPAFTSDLESNPVKSELVLGMVTVGSHAGLGPQEKWVSLGVGVGPLETEE